MKTKTTAKHVKQLYKYVVSIPYCAAQNLFYAAEPMYYTAGVYGWNADIFHGSWDVAFATGYRPAGNVNAPELVKKYDDLASDYIGLYRDNEISIEALLDYLHDLKAELAYEIALAMES